MPDNLICGDCLDILKTITDNTIDCVVTSPPYNLGKISNGSWNIPNKINYTNYNDNLPELEYQSAQKSVIKELLRVIKPSGSIFYNHKPRSRNLRVILPTDWMTELPVRQVIIWNRKGAVNCKPINFQQNTEWIVWVCKSSPKFNSEFFKYGEVWSITQDSNNSHPAPFPVEIPLRCILATTSKGDTVLDPYMGSGTTAVACKQTNRNFMGIDINPEYIEMTKRRLSVFNSIKPHHTQTLTL